MFCLYQKSTVFFNPGNHQRWEFIKKKDKKVRQTRKHAFHQENKQEKEKKKTENMLSTKKAKRITGMKKGKENTLSPK